MFESPDIANFPFTQPPGWGFSLAIVYLIWMFIVVALSCLPLVCGLQAAPQRSLAQLPVSSRFASRKY